MKFFLSCIFIIFLSSHSICQSVKKENSKSNKTNKKEKIDTVIIQNKQIQQSQKIQPIDKKQKPKKPKQAKPTFVSQGNSQLFKLDYNNTTVYLFLYIDFGNDETSIPDNILKAFKQSNKYYIDHGYLDLQAFENKGQKEEYQTLYKYEILKKSKLDTLKNPIALLTLKNNKDIKPLIDDSVYKIENDEEILSFIKGSFNGIRTNYENLVNIYNKKIYSDTVEYYEKNEIYLSLFNRIKLEDIAQKIKDIFVPNSTGFLFLNISYYKLIEKLVDYGISVVQL